MGTLKGYDQLVNLVLDQTSEFLRHPDDPSRLTTETRSLGLTVCRGTTVMLIRWRCFILHAQALLISNLFANSV